MNTLLIIGGFLLVFLIYIFFPRKEKPMWSLSKTSYLARYYIWCFDELPKSGCKYFWIAFVIVGLSPIIGFIYLIRRLFAKKEEKILSASEEKAKYNRKRKLEKIGDTTGKIFFILLGLLVLTVLIVGAIKASLNDWISIAMVLGIIVALIGFVILFRWVWLKIGIGNGIIWLLTPIWKLFANMFEFIYEKKCPIITWE